MPLSHVGKYTFHIPNGSLHSLVTSSPVECFNGFVRGQVLRRAMIGDSPEKLELAESIGGKIDNL